MIWGFTGHRRWGGRFDGSSGRFRCGLRAVVSGEGVSKAAPGDIEVVGGLDRLRAAGGVSRAAPCDLGG